MRGRAGVSHQRSRIADIIRYVDQFERVEQAMRLYPPTIEEEREDGAPRRHLPHRQFVLRMARQRRVEQPWHARLKEGRDLQRILALALDPQVERLQPLHYHPGVERRERRPGVAGE